MGLGHGPGHDAPPAKSYDESPEATQSMQEWVEKIERWMFDAMEAFKNHKEGLANLQDRLVAVEKGVEDLQKMFKSAEDAARENQAKDLAYLR